MPTGVAQLHPEVALPWVVSMRWVAVTGQAITILISVFALQLDLPLVPLGAVIFATFGTNVVLRLLISRAEVQLPEAPPISIQAGLLPSDPAPTPVASPPPPASGLRLSPKLLPAVLTLDTLFLTALLGLSGGPQNPFAILFVMHVALAAVALSSRWAWWMVGVSLGCYALIHPLHVPLRFAEGGFSETLQAAGQGLALVLVTAVVAYFASGVAEALRRREKDLREARSRVARNEWLASLAALAAGTAHELGTPLGTIAVVAKELERGAERLDNQGVLEDARLIRTQVDRCRRILDRLGALDREGLGNSPDPLDLEAVVAHLREDLLARGGSFEVSFDSALRGSERVHPDVPQAILPLIQNALDAAGQGGHVTLALSREGKRLRFEVRDDGPGMSAKVLKRAREPFFTTKEHGQGMGLGLYLVRLLSERHDGSFALEAAPAGGTRAVLTFPEASPRAARTSGRLAEIEFRASASDVMAAPLPQEAS